MSRSVILIEETSGESQVDKIFFPFTRHQLCYFYFYFDFQDDGSRKKRVVVKGKGDGESLHLPFFSLVLAVTQVEVIMLGVIYLALLLMMKSTYTVNIYYLCNGCPVPGFFL